MSTAIATVAVGTDGSVTAGRAVQAALDVAARFEARVVFLSAYIPVKSSRLEREGGDAPPALPWMITPPADVDATLRDAGDAAAARGLEWTSEAAKGDPADVLVRLAKKHDADLLVVGSKGMHRRILGSVPNSVTHRAGCSVLLVKTD